MTKTYKDIFGYFSFEPFYEFISEKYLSNGMNIVEIGSFEGKSTSYMASKIKEKKLIVNMIAVDTWKGSLEHQSISDINKLYDDFLQNMKDCEVSDYVKPIKSLSTDASKLFDNKFFDFIFIDASHEYKDVKDDITHWLPKLKDRGIIGGDDYSPVWSGVIQAVDEVLGNVVKKDFIPAWYVERN